MQRNAKIRQDHFAEDEIGTIHKRGPIRCAVALVYPNSYAVGMSNLGFQTAYRLFNEIDGVLCERAFLPSQNRHPPKKMVTVESARPLDQFDVVAFSVAYENDYPNVLRILDLGGLPLQCHQRMSSHPLVIAGGVAFFLNPEPMATFIDCFLIGEAEVLIPPFVQKLIDHLPDSPVDKQTLLKEIASTVAGIYVPTLYEPTYHADGTLANFSPKNDSPATVTKAFVRDVSNLATCTTVLTPHTTFDRTFLVEVGRGCPHGCRFCAAGFVYRPARFRTLPTLEACLDQGAKLTRQIGLVGAAVSDLPDIRQLCQRSRAAGLRLSFSSLRADALNDDLLEALQQSRVKTATIAPEAGSERLRRVIHKGITEEDILQAVTLLVEHAIFNVKLYFMIGLPTETMADVEAIIVLCKKIKHQFLKSSRNQKRMGIITVGLNCFVPKPFTPFQWAAMEETVTLKKKIKKIKEGLKTVANLRVHADIPRWAYIQALLSRGDRRVSDILVRVHENQGNWAQSLKASPMNADFYVLRNRSSQELFPWDFIDHGVRKSFLYREYQRALQK